MKKRLYFLLYGRKKLLHFMFEKYLLSFIYLLFFSKKHGLSFAALKALCSILAWTLCQLGCRAFLGWTMLTVQESPKNWIVPAVLKKSFLILRPGWVVRCTILSQISILALYFFVSTVVCDSCKQYHYNTFIQIILVGSSTQSLHSKAQNVNKWHQVTIIGHFFSF